MNTHKDSDPEMERKIYTFVVWVYWLSWFLGLLSLGLQWILKADTKNFYAPIPAEHAGVYDVLWIFCIFTGFISYQFIKRVRFVAHRREEEDKKAREEAIEQWKKDQGISK